MMFKSLGEEFRSVLRKAFQEVCGTLRYEENVKKFQPLRNVTIYPIFPSSLDAATISRW